MSQQTTRTDQFVGKPWVKSSNLKDPRPWAVIPRVHYRLITTTAGYPLSTFEGSRELLRQLITVSLVGRPCHCWFTAYGVYFLAVMDAHCKAQTLHCDVSLPNIILHRSKEGERRVGYLVDWELGCNLNNIKPRDHILIVCPIFSTLRGSPNQFKGYSRVYVLHSTAFQRIHA